MNERLLSLLSGIPNGVFIEAGANNGVWESNTLDLELSGWSGFLIEPNPTCVDLCRRYRRSRVIHAALVSDSYPHKTISGNFNRKDTSSLMCAVFDIPDYFESDSIQDIEDKTKEGAVEVPAYTLQQILDIFNCRHVDFVSFDMEGYELKALEGLDLKRIKPKYFLIETANRPVYQKQILNYMAANGYDFMEKITGNDDLFIKST